MTLTSSFATPCVIPTAELDIKEPSLREVQDVIKAARSAAAPGPRGVPYSAYKRCPRLSPATLENPESDVAEMKSCRPV